MVDCVFLEYVQRPTLVAVKVARGQGRISTDNSSRFRSLYKCHPRTRCRHANLMATLSPSLAIDMLKKTLGSTYRVTVTGRTFVGLFACIDAQGNLVLEQTVEYEHDAGDQPPDAAVPQIGRDVGMVLIPRKEWRAVQRQPLPEELSEGNPQDNTACVPS